MHELAIARAIVAVAERHADGLPVTAVRVRIGRLRQVVPASLAFYFPIAARGGVCEGAELEWEHVPSLLGCGTCGAEWDPAPPPARTGEGLVVSFRCPDCGSGDHSVMSGEELIVDEIDVEGAGASEPAATAPEPAPAARGGGG